ncbi:MAG: hypothetical protein KGH77_04410 [Candidatus Micrarchaeota archaeon]|nr:hypothetical protein [Candidatus Micrarchaeota archaeon]
MRFTYSNQKVLDIMQHLTDSGTSIGLAVDMDMTASLTVPYVVGYHNATQGTNYTTEQITNPVWWESLKKRDGSIVNSDEVSQIFKHGILENPDNIKPLANYWLLKEATEIFRTEFVSKMPEYLKPIFEGWVKYQYSGIGIKINVSTDKMSLPMNFYIDDSPSMITQLEKRADPLKYLYFPTWPHNYNPEINKMLSHLKNVKRVGVSMKNGKIREGSVSGVNQALRELLSVREKIKAKNRV